MQTNSKILNLLSVIVMIHLTSCRYNPRDHNTDSTTESLNASERINPNSVGMTQPNEIIIYYANESAPDGEELQNIQQLETRFLNYPELKGIVDSLQNDRKVFPAAVDKQLVDLKASLCGKPQKGLIAFTNRSLRGPSAASSVLVCQPNKGPEQMDLSRSFSELMKTHPKLQSNFLATNNPASMTAIFDWALTQTETLFPPATHSYILISKSHGSGQYLLTPKLTMRNADVLEDDIAKLRSGVLLKSFWYFADFILNKPAFGSNVDKPASRFARLSQLDKAGEDKAGEDKAGEDKAGEDKAGEDKAGEEKIAVGAYDLEVGVRKAAFINGLTKHSNMQFSLIFLDACKSYLPKDILVELRKAKERSNIGFIYASDEDGLPYDLLDFSKIIFDGPNRLYAIIDKALEDKVGK